MNRRNNVLLAAVALCALLPVGPAAAQYYPAPPPGTYRSLPPPLWMDADDEDDAPRSQRAPQRLPQGPGRVPQDDADARLSPPGYPAPLQQGPNFQANALPDGPDVIRPPGAVGSTPPRATPTPAAPSATSALPPEDQPEVGEAKELPANLKKQMVNYPTREPAGTIIIDTPHTYLYLVLGNGRALRYGIGVGREGFTWSGAERISRMAEWPDWHPPAEMIERQPYLPRFMAGGPGNPLGARALYLGKTLYRIHGTNQPSTIGKNVSSGCVRLLNEDIEDLFSRVQVGTRVVVLPGEPAPATVQNAPPASAPMQIGPVTEDMRADAASSGGAISSSPLPPPPTTRR